MDFTYNMGNTVLGTAVKEKDLGVTISADMKVQSSVLLQLQMVIKLLVCLGVI